VRPGDLKRQTLMTDSDADCRQLPALERQNETDAVDCCHHLDTFGHKRLRLLLRGEGCHRLIYRQGRLCGAL